MQIDSTAIRNCWPILGNENFTLWIIIWQIGKLSYFNLNDEIHLFLVTIKFRYGSMMCCGTRNTNWYIISMVCNVACFNTWLLNYVYREPVHWTDIKRLHSQHNCMYMWYQSKVIMCIVSHSDVFIFNIISFLMIYSYLLSGRGIV